MTGAEQKHVIRWFARTGPSPEYPDGRIPRGPYMQGRDWGWDAHCSCGWDSATGGAIQARVRDAVREHKWDVANGLWKSEPGW